MPRASKKKTAPPGPLGPLFRASFCGASGSGKTFALTKMLLEHYAPEAAGGPIARLIWCAPLFSLEQPALAVLEEAYGDALVKIDITSGFGPDVQREILAAIDKGRAPAHGEKARSDCILVLDDHLASRKAGEQFLSGLFSTARHRGCSVVELLQRVFVDGGRASRLNQSHVALFAFPGSGTEVARLLQDLESDRGERARVLAAYRDIVARRDHGFLFVSLNEPEGEPGRYRDGFGAPV